MIDDTQKSHLLFNKLSQSDRQVSDSGQILKSPQNVASQSVEFTLKLAAKNKSVLLAMGEAHPVLSHQVSQVLALKELVEKGQNVTLFMENPHNRLYTILIDRGYAPDNASKLAEHITADDPSGHITAKAIIGWHPHSLRGSNFAKFESQISLQSAIHHDVDIVYADAARVYPKDFCMDYSDASTNNIALKLNARRGPEGKMGPDDMLIRNAHMAQVIKEKLRESGGIGLLPTGAAHLFGINEKNNGHHLYSDSLATQFENTGIPAIMVSMIPADTLPPDYQSDIAGGQIRLFEQPSSTTFTDAMSDKDIENFLFENNLDPTLYDPRKFSEAYREEFDTVLSQAEIELGIERPLFTKATAPQASAASTPPAL